MKKFKYILIIIFLLVIIGAIIYFYVSNTNENYDNEQTNSDSNASRTSTDINIQNEESPKKETQLSTFSTVIGDNSPGRLTNIRITCSIIDGTIINPNEIFSFNDIVGEPTAERGYQEAKVIIDHKTEIGIGGGNCQVSTTLYNAVLTVPSLTVVERSEHGKSVGYVPEGRDAAVSYGSLDFKFKNSSDNKIKINVSTDDKNITASILSIEN